MAYLVFLYPYIYVYLKIKDTVEDIISIVIPRSDSSANLLDQDAPQPIEKDENKDGKNTASDLWDFCEGYVLLVKDGYDKTNPPLLKPSDIPKLLKPAPKKKDKRQIQRDNLYYATLYGPMSSLHFSPRSKNQKKIVMNLTEWTIDYYPLDLPQNKFFSRSFPILLQNKEDETVRYFLFCPTGISKERWTLSLKKNSSLFRIIPAPFPPYLLTPQPSSASVADIWLNSMLQRMWNHTSKTEKFNESIRRRVQGKIDKIKKPSFIGDVRMKHMKLGTMPPQFTGIAVESNTQESLVIGGHVCYNGGFELQLETEAKIDVPTSKPVKFNIQLAINIQELKGKIVLQINQLPSSRIWWAFKEQPKLSMNIKPLLGDRNVGFNMVKDAIERKILEAIQDSLVLPNMEDISMFGADEHRDMWINYLVNERKASVKPEDLLRLSTPEPSLPESSLISSGSSSPISGVSTITRPRGNSFSPKLNSRLGNMYTTSSLSIIHAPPLPQNHVNSQD